MRRPFFATGAIPKKNHVIRVPVKENSKIVRHSNRMQLEWMGRQINNMSCSWYSIYNDNDLINVWQLNSLINSIFNGILVNVTFIT